MLTARLPRMLRAAAVCGAGEQRRPAATRAPGARVPARVAVLGAGLAGLSVAWHLLEEGPRASASLSVDVYDAGGIAAGASGAAAGLLHGHTPRGKLLWKGREGVERTAALLAVAEAAARRRGWNEPLAWREGGILRPASGAKQAADMRRFVPPEGSEACCGPASSSGRDAGEALYISAERAAQLLPGLGPAAADYGGAIWLPRGIVLSPERYLRGLWAACEDSAAQQRAAGASAVHVLLHRRNILSLAEMDGSPYDAVVICAGAAVGALAEAADGGPLACVREMLLLCRGTVLEMEPTEDAIPATAAAAGACGGGYPVGAPSLLGPTYLAAHGPRRLLIGATKEYGVSPAEAMEQIGRQPGEGEAKAAATELLPGAGRLFAPLTSWRVAAARVGVRAMPPNTCEGKTPLAGRLRAPSASGGPAVWLLAGLGSRGLVHHSWLGQALALALLHDTPAMLPREVQQWQDASWAARWRAARDRAATSGRPRDAAD